MAISSGSTSAAAPASLFGLPGITRRFEQVENNDGLVFTLSTTSQTTATGVIPFKQTDVVMGWDIEFTIAQTYTAGTSTLTLSSYFPYNWLGAVSLNLQNQFQTINVASGIDLALFQIFRPMNNTDDTTVLYTNPFSMYSAQTNLVSAGNYTAASTSVKFRLELPAGLWFNKFYVLDADGRITYPNPLRTFVSPAFMAGTARVVQPSISFNPGSASTTDNAPVNIGAGTGTFAGNATINVRRRGWYQPQGLADSPPIYDWQLSRKTTTFSLSGKSVADIPVPLNGQILLVYVRLFDPAASAGLGAPIALSAVTKCQLLYGSGLFRYQDTPTDMQARILRQHGFLPTNGLIAWDMAVDELGDLTNADAINTMNTSGVTIHLEFTGAQSSSAYAVVGVEALTYVEPA